MSKELTSEKWLTPKPRYRKCRCVVYDFDGTLFKSPNREEGELAYMEATGNTFPFAGWWGRLESLSPPVIPELPGEEWLIARTVAAYQEDAKDNNTEIVLMTGRPYKHRKRVLAICDHLNLKFHSHYFRGQPGQYGRDTLEIKANFIVNDLIHDGLNILEIWEDRQEHVSAFFDLAKRWKSKYRHLEKIVIHDVFLEKSNNI